MAQIIHMMYIFNETDGFAILEFLHVDTYESPEINNFTTRTIDVQKSMPPDYTLI